jgi:hypothetical protein
MSDLRLYRPADAMSPPRRGSSAATCCCFAKKDDMAAAAPREGLPRQAGTSSAVKSAGQEQKRQAETEQRRLLRWTDGGREGVEMARSDGVAAAPRARRRARPPASEANTAACSPGGALQARRQQPQTQRPLRRAAGAAAGLLGRGAWEQRGLLFCARPRRELIARRSLPPTTYPRTVSRLLLTRSLLLAS